MENDRIKILDDFSNLVEFRTWALNNQHIIMDNQDAAQIFSKRGVMANVSSGWFGKELQNMRHDNAWHVLNKGIDTFEHMGLLEKLESKLTQSLSIRTPNPLPNKKLSYNDLGLGVFSFDRAAQGMYRLKELYSPIHDRVFQPEEVIMKGQEIRLRRDNSLIEERWEMKEGNRPRIRTTSKKVWAYFPKVKRQRAAAEIYIRCGNMADVSAENLLYTGLPGIIIAKKMIAASIPVKVNLVIGQRSQGFFTCAVIPVKDYHEPLDVNLIALTTSDARFYRHEGIKACAIMNMMEGKHWNGRSVNSQELENLFEDVGYRTHVPNRFYFGKVDNESEAESRIREAIERINNTLEA